MRRAGALALLAFLAVGCGSTAGGGGKATLWVTRDQGARVLLVRQVPAGQTAMQALDREADVSTRYGGRYVESINGIEGSFSGRRDWFYFVNGYEADRSAAEYRLHPGDVEWWDYRSWRQRLREPVVVGAFPEPFLHGYDGKSRPAAVRYGGSLLAKGARALGRIIHAESVSPLPAPVPENANVLVVTEGGLIPRFTAGPRDREGGAGSPVSFSCVCDALRLARHPELVRFHYRYQVEP